MGTEGSNVALLPRWTRKGDKTRFSTFGLGAAYGVYTIAAAISLFFVLFFIKETKGIELENM
ncbi:hypothetical protein [Brasilonema bromeliae]|uniref:Uncharacterized protein n=1 Tax=Brasilonema bromeliae SPC951 TaxID=385972 RepID=A0ABX1P8S8_9CYAN|nr:hypothetical protein [Brasilonema bromeliae SPC951]